MPLRGSQNPCRWCKWHYGSVFIFGGYKGDAPLLRTDSYPCCLCDCRLLLWCLHVPTDIVRSTSQKQTGWLSVHIHTSRHIEHNKHFTQTCCRVDLAEFEPWCHTCSLLPVTWNFLFQDAHSALVQIAISMPQEVLSRGCIDLHSKAVHVGCLAPAPHVLQPAQKACCACTLVVCLSPLYHCSRL